MSLQTENLSAGYGNRPVLHDITFALNAGQSIALLGPNGSGKSTLLKALTKTIPFTGSVTVDHQDLRTLSFKALADLIAFVPQEEIAAFPFQVRDVIALARISKTGSLHDTKEDQVVVERSAEQADCTDLLDRPITELSGGEHQRVLIARALAQETPIMLLDEPTSHLDIRHQLEVTARIRQLTQLGKAVIVAVHDLNLAPQLADHALLLHQGRLRQAGPIRDVFASEQIDEVYGVAFERQVQPGGVPLMIPSPAHLSG